MRAPPRPPARRAPPPIGLWVAGLGGSAALHAAALAAMLFWPGRDDAPQPGAPEGVALIFEDTEARGALPDPAGADLAPPETGVAAAEAIPPPGLAEADTPPAQDAAPPALPPDTAEPPPPVRLAAPEPPVREESAAPAEAPAPPAPAVAEAAEPLPPPPPAPQAEPSPSPAPQRLAALAPSPPAGPGPARPRPEPIRLNAGAAALPDPSAGARAMGAVTPPAAAPGERNAPPDYPAESRRRGEEGVVRLTLRIGSDGRVETAEVTGSSGYPALDRAALDAVRRWRFRPAVQAGLPVAASLGTAVHFRLTEAERR